MNLPERVAIVEVGPSDGLQSQGALISLADKVQFVDLLSGTGLRVIEVGAFVSPKRVPQMANSDEVFQKIHRLSNIRYPVLVPDEPGLDRALEVGAKEIAISIAASETFNQKNSNASIDESIDGLRLVTRRARHEGIRVRGHISTCFGCPYEGAVDPGKVSDVVQKLDGIGVDEFSIGDTIGVANPAQIETVFSLLMMRHRPERLALHAHDTRGTALTNCYHALTLGIPIFDSSAGGVGGCPFAPGATGNLATEDLVYLMNGLGVETGVDLDKLVDASAFLEPVLKTRLPGRTHQAIRAARVAGE
jgi:hydroxymethylglutaryl-CoA lyase